MRKVLFIFIGLLVVILASGAGILALIGSREGSQTSEEVLKEDSETVKIGKNLISVLIAQTPEERSLGLSGKKSLLENQGMLFVFEQENIQPTFWMKGMLFALDIIWINDAKIVQINQNVFTPNLNTPDQNLILYSSNQPIDHVLEVNAGFTEKNNIKVGDNVLIPATL